MDIFIPEYWNPPNLFNLIDKIGFSIESLLLGFLVGGIASVIYEFVGKKRIKKIRKQKLNNFTPYLLFIIIFLGLEIIFPDKSIYNLSASLIVSSTIIGFLRKDLIKQIVIIGFLFSFIYFVIFVIFNLIFNEFVNKYYNLNNLWGINLLGVPIEEIIFSFSVGAFWSTLFEYIKGYKIKSLSFFNRM